MRVFISYRREDQMAAAVVRQAFADLRGPDSVYIDLDLKQHPGAPWRTVLEDEIRRSTDLVLVIAAGWPVDELERPDDPVRAELLAARDAGLRIVPLLVGGVPFPAELPSDLGFLGDYNAATMRSADPYADCAALVEQLWPDANRRFDVVLYDLGRATIRTGLAIQQIRPDMSLGELDALSHSDDWPVVVLSDVDSNTASEAVDALEKAGANAGRNARS